MRFPRWRHLRQRFSGWASGVNRAGSGRFRPARPVTSPRQLGTRGPLGSQSWSYDSRAEPRYIRLVDATEFSLTTHVIQLIGASSGAQVLLDEPPSADTLAAVTLFPVGRQGARTEEAMRFLSELASQCDRADTSIPIALFWCVRASERVNAVLPHRGGTNWGNYISLSTAGAWADVRVRHQSDRSALREIDTHMTDLLRATSHNTAIGGNTQRALHYVDRIARGRFHLGMLAECLSHPGSWHGHEVLAAAVNDLVPGASSDYRALREEAPQPGASDESAKPGSGLEGSAKP